MLAKLTDDYFSSDRWIYERKLDGERVLAFCKNGSVTLYSRNRKKLNNTYPELVDALEKHGRGDFIVDGEVVAFEGSRTSFARLQNRMKIKDKDAARAADTRVYYYLFDLIYADGYNLDKLPLVERKKLLRESLSFSDPLRFTPHRNREGERYHREACKKGWEGIIAKRAAGAYKHSRSGDWLKFKCVNEQELVIGGYTEPGGSRIGFGALLVGYYKNKKLKYAGKIGTGYDHDTLKSLSEKLKGIERDDSPFDEPVREKTAHFVDPNLVAQVGFTEWTDDGKLRHPRYLGLRRDKSPKKVHREKPEQNS